MSQAAASGRFHRIGEESPNSTWQQAPMSSDFVSGGNGGGATRRKVQQKTYRPIQFTWAG